MKSILVVSILIVAVLSTESNDSHQCNIPNQETHNQTCACDKDFTAGYKNYLKEVVYNGNSIIYTKYSDYIYKNDEMDIHLVKTDHFGKMLYMDGYVQSSDADKHVYHESLVQPAFLYFKGKPKRVLIGGGGELMTAAEVLKHETVEVVDMVDISKEAVEQCKTELFSFHNDSWKDPRLKIVYSCVYEYLKNYKGEPYDIVIMDIEDPTENYSILGRLYMKEFYSFVKKNMNPEGVFVTQGTGFHQVNWKTPAIIRRTAEAVWGNAFLYRSFCVSYMEMWGFVMAGAFGHIENCEKVIKSGEGVDEKLAESKIDKKLQYYDKDAHLAMFAISKDLKIKIYDNEKIPVASEETQSEFVFYG